MSLLFARERRDAKSQLIPPRTSRLSIPAPTVEDARRNSAVWACTRLRADLLSTLPLDVFVRVNGVQYERPRPKVLTEPGGSDVRYMEWMYSTQQDLDTFGNTFGIITARDAANRPARVDLIPARDVTVRQDKDRVVTYWYGGTKYNRDEIWHEKQYTVAGLAVGLSPIAYAALAISQATSAQEFTVGWYTNSAVPSGILRNNSKDLTRAEALDAKESYRAAVSGGDIWVAGKAWEFSPMTAQKADTQFLAAQQATLPDIARYMSCPADLIDAMVSGGSSVTYANIVQRNLQFLIMNFGPAIARREEALTHGMIRDPQYVKLNSDALLRMDPQTVSAMFGQQVRDRLRAPSEIRDLWNLPPLTEAQLAEFDRLSPAPAQADLARALQQIYLSVGKVITSDEARQIVNEQFGASLALPGPSFEPGGTS